MSLFLILILFKWLQLSGNCSQLLQTFSFFLFHDLDLFQINLSLSFLLRLLRYTIILKHYVTLKSLSIFDVKFFVSRSNYVYFAT